MKHIEFRLYRHHTIRVQGEYLKDLSRIGRDLSSLIIVDNL
jgi:TFIIF-interacting CTD phosphatase-like protein